MTKLKFSNFSQKFRSSWIRSQHRQLQAMLLRLLDRGLHAGVVLMALGIDEEVILPVHFFARPLLDVGEIDSILFEYIENFREGARLVRGGEHDRRLVVAAFSRRLAADHEDS